MSLQGRVFSQARGGGPWLRVFSRTRDNFGMTAMLSNLQEVARAACDGHVSCAGFSVAKTHLARLIYELHNQGQRMEILLIEDNPALRMFLAATLRAGGQQVSLASDGNQGMQKLRTKPYDLVISDVRMPGPDGFTILEYARRSKRAPDVILMTAHGAIGDAVNAIKQRATDYLVKPFAPEDLLHCVEKIEERQQLNDTIGKAETEQHARNHGLVGVSESMAYVREQIDAIGPSGAPVLITGESGTGKELVARALHETSGRSGPFVAVNCASFPSTLLEAELFGHERGAFTGADRARVGRFEAAAGGTLFLDEISEMELSCQAKLLRVLQERVFSPLGTNKEIAVEARILSATNRPLRSLIEARQFREDLFYRIQVLTIELPPLRERQGDIIPLCAHFLRRFGASQTPLAVSDEAWQLICEHPFHGNVRELEHTLQHAAVMARAGSSESILPQHLPKELREMHKPESASSPSKIQQLASSVAAFERDQLLRALALCNGNKTRAAQSLGISRKTLWEKMRKQSISDEEVSDRIAQLPPRKPGYP